MNRRPDRNPKPPRTGNRFRVFLAAALILGGAGYALVRIVTEPVDSRGSSDSPSLPASRFFDVTDQAGIRFRHHNGATGKKLLPETMGSGVAVLDFDGDGWPDLFFVNGRSWPGESNMAAGRTTSALYRNRGDGTFEDVTAAAGLDVEIYGMGVAVGDCDNDGRPDLFVTALGGNRLYRNRDGKRFVDITDSSGLGSGWSWPNESNTDFVRRETPIDFPSSATWIDYDGDGRLDLFVCYYLNWSPGHDLGVMAVLPGGRRAYVPPQQFAGTRCRLYRNIDGLRFEDVSAIAGVDVFELDDPGRVPRPVGKSLGVVACDPDRDGWADLVVANDTVRNFFFHNVPGPNGARVYREEGLFSGIAYADGRPRGGMGIDAGDIRPNTSAIMIANFANEPSSLFKFLGSDPIRFVDIASDSGLAGPSRPAMKFGTLFFDFDLDGRLDSFTANGHLEPEIASALPGQTHAQPAQLLWNSGQTEGQYKPVGGFPFPPMVGRGCAYLDYDGDGQIDLVVTENGGQARLFRNESGGSNSYIRLELAGADGTNRDAIGAEVTIQTAGGTQRRFIAGARGYLSQSDIAVHFGLGTTTQVDRVTVRWPGRDNRTQVWRELSAGATYRLTEGSVEARRSSPSRIQP